MATYRATLMNGQEVTVEGASMDGSDHHTMVYSVDQKTVLAVPTPNLSFIVLEDAEKKDS